MTCGETLSREISTKRRLVKMESVLILGLFGSLLGSLSGVVSVIIVLVVVIAVVNFFLEEMKKGQKLASEKEREERQKEKELLRLESEKIAKAFKPHGISKTDLPAIICHCHSCSKIFVVARKCNQCGSSAATFKRTTNNSGSTTGFYCTCAWGYEIASCPCGTNNSAVRFGQYGIEGGNLTHRSGRSTYQLIAKETGAQEPPPEPAQGNRGAKKPSRQPPAAKPPSNKGDQDDKPRPFMKTARRG